MSSFYAVKTEDVEVDVDMFITSPCQDNNNKPKNDRTEYVSKLEYVRR